jgi:cobalt/nickel transport system ATP-binding protein
MGEYRMMNLLMRLNKEQGITIVMATHRVDLVPLFLDRLYILSRGRMVREGSPEDVFTTPDEMEEMRLRLPQIGELIYRLKHDDRLPFDKIPLTIGEAREEIIRLVK